MNSALHLNLMAIASIAAVSAAEPGTLRLVQTIALPKVSGRFDHFAIDTAGKRLFVAALGNNTAEAIDVATFARLHSIRDLRKPTGVAYLQRAGKVVIANGDDGTLRFFDGKTFAPAERLAPLDDADNVRYDASAQRLYVGFGDGALGIVDAAAGKLLGRIEVKGHPESFQLECEGPRIFVNIPDANMIAVIDREKRAIVAQWPMEHFRANFPLAFDEAGHRLFVGCRQPARLVIVDTTAGKPVANLEISGDTDDLFFDAKRQRVYVSCGEGFIDVVQCRDGNRYERLERVPTRAGARTSFFSPELDQLYLAVPQRAGQEAEVRIFQPD